MTHLDPNQTQPLPFARAISRELDSHHNHAVEQAAQLCEAAAQNKPYLVRAALLGMAQTIRAALTKP